MTPRSPHRPSTRITAAALAMVVLCGLSACSGLGRSSARDRAARGHLAQAQSYLSQGLSDAALESFGLALEQNPRLLEAQMGIGGIYRQRGDYQQAETAYLRATEIAPSSFDAYYLLALMRQLGGKLEEAVRAYLRALTINPRSFEANSHLAATYLQLNRPAEALPYARRSTQLKAGDQAAWANLAAAHSLLAQYEEAVEAYRQAVELGEQHEALLLGLADAHLRLGRYERATNVLDAVIRKHPSSTAYERLGYCRFKQRDFENALGSYRSAVELDPKDTAALNGLGACLMTLYLQSDRGDSARRDEALRAWRQSLSVRGDQPRITDLIARYTRM